MYYETFLESCCCSFPKISDPMWTLLPGAFLTKGESWTLVYCIYQKCIFDKVIYFKSVFVNVYLFPTNL